MAGGTGTLEVEGSTVSELLDRLERDYPRLAGWVRDEGGSLREHVTVFVNGERAPVDQAVSTADRVHILPAISGGSGHGNGQAELLVGTHKGLFVLRGPRGGAMDIAARQFDGVTAEFAMRDPRTGTYYASVTDGQY